MGTGAGALALPVAAWPDDGRYRVLAELGEGGMGQVLLAVARGPVGVNKLCVMKVLRPLLAQDPPSVKMFLGEGRIAARLAHPNVVQTFGVAEAAGRQAIVMEYLDGRSLAQIAERTRGGQAMPMSMQLHVLASVLAGLQYAHDLTDYDGTPLGLVHRDVSPHNVFVTFDGQVKVLDFGIAKVQGGRSVTTSAGIVKGKIRYMAPEQMSGEAVDRRADLFGVGAMLWEALTGAEIWKETVDVAVMRRVLQGEVPPPHDVNPEVPAALEAICVRAMATSRDARYATAAEMQEALEAEAAKLGGYVKPRELGAFVSELFADERAAMRALIEKALGREGGGAGQASVQEAPAREKEATPTEPARRANPLWVAAGLLVAATAAVLVVRARGPAVETAGAVAPAPAPAPAPASASASASAPAPAPAPASASASSSDTPAAPSSARPRTLPPAGGMRPHASASAAPVDCSHPYFVDARGIKSVKPECL